MSRRNPKPVPFMVNMPVKLTHGDTKTDESETDTHTASTRTKDGIGIQFAVNGKEKLRESAEPDGGEEEEEEEDGDDGAEDTTSCNCIGCFRFLCSCSKDVVHRAAGWCSKIPIMSVVFDFLRFIIKWSKFIIMWINPIEWLLHYLCQYVGPRHYSMVYLRVAYAAIFCVSAIRSTVLPRVAAYAMFVPMLLFLLGEIFLYISASCKKEQLPDILPYKADANALLDASSHGPGPDDSIGDADNEIGADASNQSFNEETVNNIRHLEDEEDDSQHPAKQKNTGKRVAWKDLSTSSTAKYGTHSRSKSPAP